MIQINISGKWGTSPIEEVNPETGEVLNGRQITILDDISGIAVHAPFTGPPLEQLVRELSQGLTVEQKKTLAPIFSGGVHLPNGLEIQSVKGNK